MSAGFYERTPRQLTSREFAKRWAKGVRSRVFNASQAIAVLNCARDIEYSLRSSGEDTRWLARYINDIQRGVASRVPREGFGDLILKLTDQELIQLARIIQASHET